MYANILIECFIPAVLFVWITSAQSTRKPEECFTQLSIEPAFISVGQTKILSIICKASTLLRLRQFRDAEMYIQKQTPDGPRTIASLDFNDTVKKFGKDINVIGFYPTNFEVILQNPGCDDVVQYGCYVNHSTLKCRGSRQRLRLQRRMDFEGLDGPPLLTITPRQDVYTAGDIVRVTCSSAFGYMRRMFTMDWTHPTGRPFPANQVRARIDSESGCNDTSTVTFTLRANDNGAKIVCVTGSIPSSRSMIILNVTERNNAITIAPVTQEVPCQGWSVYMVVLIAVGAAILSVALYTTILLVGGTKLKLPCGKKCFMKTSIYDIPIRDSSQETEDSKYETLKSEPFYINNGSETTEARRTQETEPESENTYEESKPESDNTYEETKISSEPAYEDVWEKTNSKQDD